MKRGVKAPMLSTYAWGDIFGFNEKRSESIEPF
jgi:hypothetical protein